MSKVVLKNVTKIYDKKKVIDNVDLTINDKEFVVLVGASGCGKSTILRMIAGLEEITSGEIFIGDKKVNDIQPKDRDIAFVFQSYALYPHMTVRENIAFGLKMRKVDKATIEKKVQEAAEILDLTEYLDRKPKQLSGGQRQRVALGRAIVRNPKVFLMDEPLSNLDAKLRVQMRSEIKKLHEKLQTTFIYVTHDQTEALTMGDRIVVLDKGVIQQFDRPEVIYDNPANTFVAGFIGSPQMNFINADVNGNSIEFDGCSFTNPKDLGERQKVILGIRPEKMICEGVVKFSKAVEMVELLGSEKIVYFNVGNQKCSAKLPAETVKAKPRPPLRHKRRVLMLEGCAQPTLSPNTNAATARVLDRLGISVMPANEAGCCGAVDYHLNAQEKGLARARNNIDAWWPAIEAGAEAILQTASGCGAFVKEYGQMLKNDALYADKARQVSELAVDLVELLREEPLEKLAVRGDKKLAFHCPCTLQHAQKLNGEVEKVLLRLGFTLTDVPDSHLCCGSAGTYALTHPDLARQLRDNKMNALESGKPEMIVTANIGCQTHLASAGRTSVRHWIEIVEQALEKE